MNRHFLGSCPFAESTLSGIFVGDQIWISIDYNQLDSNVDIKLTIAGMALSTVTNAVTTMMIVYKLWYVAVGWIHWVQWLTKK